MKTYFNFCDVIFEINSERQLLKHSDNFYTDNRDKDVTVNIKSLPFFKDIEFTYLGKANEKTAWRKGKRIIRRTTDICLREPHIEINYSIDDINNIDAFVKQSESDWATSEKYLWTGFCLNQIMLYFNTLFFHASYIEVNGYGILFTAPSQTGKSTQAELWRKYRNAEVINGDKAAVRIKNIITVNSLPFSGTSGICKNKTLPLKAIVYLSQAPENTVRRMGASEAVTALCPNVFADKLVSEEWSKTLNLLLDLVSNIPIYHLACTPDVRAVEELEKYL